MSRAPLSKKRPVCVQCGAVYGRRHTANEEVRWPWNEPMPPYRGNGVVVKTSEPRKLGLKAEFLAEQEKRSHSHWGRTCASERGAGPALLHRRAHHARLSRGLGRRVLVDVL